MLQAGQAIDAVTADNDLAVVVDDYGIMSPILLYFAHLKGWSFDPGDLSPEVVDNLRRLGARYFVTTQWSHLARVRPDATSFLERYEDRDGARRAAGHRCSRSSPLAVADQSAPMSVTSAAY